MALTNNFKIFGESSTNIYTDENYANLTERQTGFQPQTVANSMLANTAIMANSKFISAFIDICSNTATSSASYTIGPNSTAKTIAQFYTTGLSYVINRDVKFDVTRMTSNNVDKLTFSIGNKSTSQKFEVDNIKASNAVTAQTAENASNVTDAINGHSISDIFMADGLKVKSAYYADYSYKTSFSNSFSNIQLSENPTTLDLADTYTYEIYIDVTNNSTSSTERFNFGTFVYDSSKNTSLMSFNNDTSVNKFSVNVLNINNTAISLKVLTIFPGSEGYIQYNNFNFNNYTVTLYYRRII